MNPDGRGREAVVVGVVGILFRLVIFRQLNMKQGHSPKKKTTERVEVYNYYLREWEG